MKASLNLLVLRSTDMDRAVRFYGALGLAFTPQQHGAGPKHWSATVDGVVFEIYPAGRESSLGVRIGFEVEGVDDVVATLAANGGTIVSPPGDGEWGRRAVVRDPDGHAVEISFAG